jgi:hypothetical protein
LKNFDALEDLGLAGESDDAEEEEEDKELPETDSEGLEFEAVGACDARLGLDDFL